MLQTAGIQEEYRFVVAGGLLSLLAQLRQLSDLGADLAAQLPVPALSHSAG